MCFFIDKISLNLKKNSLFCRQCVKKVCLFILKNIYKNTIWFIDILLLLIGATVIYGWFINSSQIVQILPNLTPMQFNTALCFLLSGVSVLFLLFNNPNLRKISKTLNYSVGLICILTIIQYVTNINLGIDELLFKYPIDTNMFHVGRMAPDTAIAFFIFSHALSIEVTNKKQQSLHLIFGFLVLGLGSLNLLGYIFNFESIVRLSNLTQMALHTSISFMLMGILLVIYYAKAVDFKHKKYSFPWKRYTISITIILLFLDIRFPIGIATGSQYLILIFFGWYITNKRAQISLTIISTICILLGHYINSYPRFFNNDLSSRLFTILIIWIVTFIILDLIKKKITIEEKITELQINNNKLKQFNYITSHDLQEPISSIIGFSNILITKHGEELEESSLKSLKYIKKSANRMQQLMKKLLEHSLIGDSLKMKKLSCNELLKNIEEDFELKLSKKNGMLIYNKLPTIKASKVEIELLFQNLISNSIKFAKKNVPLKIEIEGYTKKEYWYFKVKDNGIGIDEKEFKNIFYIFKRLNKKSTYKGYGIGLANCKKYVELHKGEIWATSKVNEGTIIHFTIKRNA